MSLQTGNVPKVQDYGVIGDCRSAALVSRYGAVEFLCWPQFDSNAIFAAIVDRERGGYWSLLPEHLNHAGQTYVQDSNVLETRFHCANGEALLTDLMPVWAEDYKRSHVVPEHQLVRRLVCSKGEVRVEMLFRPRANFGRTALALRERGALGLQMACGRGVYWLRSTVPLQLDDDGASARFNLKRGDEVQFSLSYAEESPTVIPALGGTIREAIDRSVAWWQQWASRSQYSGPYRESVTRSALALKLLTYCPSGAVVAAATTSLPERVGDTLNWDYRYCWLRDASLTIRALLGLGYVDEAESFLTWLLHATSMTQPELHVLYTVFGQVAPHERELGYLSGYRDSRPVRVGNDARGQVQLDIYGEVIDAAAQFAHAAGAFDRTTQRVLIDLGKYVCGHWDSADQGIWEPRSGPEHHTHSRLMCWTALDRLLRLQDAGLIEGAPEKDFRAAREQIRRQIETRAWNTQLQSYASTLDGNRMDATLLRLSWYGLERADCERMKRTHARVNEVLGAGNSLLYRYQRAPQEGAFGVCGFWGVEQLALGGSTLDAAQRAFEQLLSYQTELGLCAEEIDPRTGDALGNFPQAFTHIGLISAALSMEERRRRMPHPKEKVGSDTRLSGTEVKK